MFLSQCVRVIFSHLVSSKSETHSYGIRGKAPRDFGHTDLHTSKSGTEDVLFLSNAFLKLETSL